MVIELILPTRKLFKRILPAEQLMKTVQLMPRMFQPAILYCLKAKNQQEFKQKRYFMMLKMVI